MTDYIEFSKVIEIKNNSIRISCNGNDNLFLNLKLLRNLSKNKTIKPLDAILIMFYGNRIEYVYSNGNYSCWEEKN